MDVPFFHVFVDMCSLIHFYITKPILKSFLNGYLWFSWSYLFPLGNQSAGGVHSRICLENFSLGISIFK